MTTIEGARPLVMLVGGTRPEAIKLAPLVRALRERRVDTVLVATGQQPMFADALAWFGLAPDLDLAVPNRDLAGFCAGLRAALAPVLALLAPDLVLVQGDTSSAWAAAQAAHGAGVPLGHVEAGLRSGDPLLPWPEERFRQEIDALSALLFAPTPAAAANLAGHAGEVHLTGNTGIDALLWTRANTDPVLHDSATRLLLVTCHRREAIPRLPALAEALRRLAARPDVTLFVPLHPNPAVGEALRRLLGNHPRIRLDRPAAYPDLVRLLDAAHLLLTDSGGLQEEAPALGLPTLVLRDVTERQESIACGAARLVGLDPDRIVAEAARLLDDPAAHAAMARPAFPFGRGDAARRIVAAVVAWWSRHRPIVLPAAAPGPGGAGALFTGPRSLQ